MAAMDLDGGGYRAGIRKSIGYVVAGVLCVYALVYKIPIPCFGCQRNGFWYRCVMDTGDGTASCSAHLEAKKRVETAGRIIDQAGVYMDNLWDFTRNDLPGVIQDFIETLKDQILGLKDRMAAKIGQIIAFLQEKVLLFASKVKEATTETYDKFLSVVINPVIKFFISNLLQPVVTVFTKIVEFRDLVWETLSRAIDSFANISIGEFVGDVVDVLKKIPEAMDSIKHVTVKLINAIKNNMIGVVNTGIRESIEGVEKSVNLLSGKLDDGVNLAIGGLNKVKNELVSNLNTQINTMGSGIENAINATTGVIETGVNSALSGVTTAVNASTKQVEQGVGRIITTTNDVVGGAEVAVNLISTNMNKALNGVESGVNSVSKAVNTAINKVLDPVQDFVDTLNSIRRKDYPLIGKAFGWLPTIPMPTDQAAFDKLSIADIPSAKFGRVNASLDIPDVKIKGIDIGEVNIPSVNINPPSDINNVDIPDVNIPGVEIPIPADIHVDDLDFPSIPGLGFMSDKIGEIKDAIVSIFETAMTPLYDGVATLIALVGSVISSASRFFNEYLTWTAIKQRVSQLVQMTRDGVVYLKDLLVSEIVPGFVSLIKSMKDPILAFVKTVADHTWSFMKKIGTNVASIFNEAYKTIVKVTGVIAKGVFHTGLFIVGTTVERYTGFIPLPISVKLLLFMVTILYMLFGGLIRNAREIIGTVIGATKSGATAIVDLDREVEKRLRRSLQT